MKPTIDPEELRRALIFRDGNHGTFGTFDDLELVVAAAREWLRMQEQGTDDEHPVICIGEHTIRELRAGRDVNLERVSLIPASDLLREPAPDVQAQDEQRESEKWPERMKRAVAEKMLQSAGLDPEQVGKDIRAFAWETMQAAARREGRIKGLQDALGLIPLPSSTTQWDVREAITAEIERAQKEGQ